MLDSLATLLVLRNRLLTTVVVTTGSIDLAATTDGYTRSAGSFLTDGFVKGQEILPSGFDENLPEVITEVDALTIKTRQVHNSQASGSGRALIVGLPSIRAWENIKKKTDRDLWAVTEQYLPGPNPDQRTKGPLGWIDHYPTYVVTFKGHSDVGSAALYKMADAVLLSFPPRDALTLVDGTVLRVRSQPGPMRGQVMQDEDGFSMVVVTIPIWARTQNII